MTGCVCQKECSVPPLDHMRLVVPVLPGPVCVHFSVNPRSARHRTRHVRQFGTGGEGGEDDCRGKWGRVEAVTLLNTCRTENQQMMYFIIYIQKRGM